MAEDMIEERGALAMRELTLVQELKMGAAHMRLIAEHYIKAAPADQSLAMRASVAADAAAAELESLRASLTRVEEERDEARDDYMRRHKDATDRWLLLEEAKAALEPIANAARTLEMDGIEGYPFDDPREVLWAGEGGTISVSDFRRAAELHTRLSRASPTETERSE